ncbi:DUF5518 domain-containing protein [Natronomonas salina]|uniref:DUF5518 domain-containing protein n=1 Tax=Natronomonas salina TaxID=1710540 RepID=UPI0015B73633|nr:DUF5518 domain-containing protein [Natronomonas salina]QLD88805.1 DUF5518 domain-containing protein [Natronomonas salina]
MAPPTDDDSTTAVQPLQSEPPTGIDSDESTNPDVPDVPSVLDWLLGGLVVLGGFVLALPGVLLYTAVDRANVETVVASEDFTVEGMTEPEFVDLTLALLPWLAAGLLVTGLAMIAVGIAYVVHRRRVHARAAAGEATSDYPAHALLGAVVSTVTSFVPLSPVLGGVVAGYLERGDSERTISVGAASGLVVSAPFLVIGVFAAAGLASGLPAIANSGFAAMVAGVVIVGALVSLAFTVGLGAAGGWIGGKLAE